MAVLQDDSLKNPQEDIKDVEDKRRHCTECSIRKNREHTLQQYGWISEPLTHAGHTVYWLNCTESVFHYDKDGKLLKDKVKEPGRFVFLTNQVVGKENVCTLAKAGRRRWKIEDGFNEQKNRGYHLGHKFCRKSFTAYKNYYQCMQIAHAINQLVEHSSEVAKILADRPKMTIKHLWENLISYLTMLSIDQSVLEMRNSFQIRLTS